MSNTRSVLPRSIEPGAIWADRAPIRKRLEMLGIHEIAPYRHLELTPDAELHLPPVGAPTPPRGRPPRGGIGGT